MRTLIKNGTVATASDLYPADVLVEGEKVTMIGLELGSKVGQVERTLDASGKFVLPGGIDPHTHLDMPFGGTFSADDFESGTRAAAFGGTTSVVDFAIQPKGGSLRAGLDEWHQKAQGKACTDYAFHLIVRELGPETLAEMDLLVKEGVPSFKVFTAYPGVFLVDDGLIFKALQRSRENGSLIGVHCENGPVIDILVQQALARGDTGPKWHALTRPPRLEGEATSRVIALAEVAGAPIYIVHVSAAEAVEEIRRARERGVEVRGETCPQYLFLSTENYDEPGFDGARYVMSPPLRGKGNEQALWSGLKLGHLSTVATDHCPFLLKEKELGLGNFAKIPNGAPGLEMRMSLLWDGGVRGGRIDVSRFVDVTSTSAAKIFGMYPKKGTVAVGSDADLVVFDPEKEVRWSAKSHHMKVDYNPYEGRVCRGAPTHVFSRGQLIVEHDQWLGKAGAGKFVRRAARQK